MKTSSNYEHPRYVRAAAIAKAYDVSARCVYLWAESGKIPYIRIGKTIRFDCERVYAALETAGTTGAIKVDP